jgi:hypothetical protein
MVGYYQMNIVMDIRVIAATGTPQGGKDEAEMIEFHCGPAGLLDDHQAAVDDDIETIAGVVEFQRHLLAPEVRFEVNRGPLVDPLGAAVMGLR